MNLFNIILILIIISILILILLLLKYNLCNSSTSRNVIEKFDNDDDIDEDPPTPPSFLTYVNPENQPMNQEIDKKLSDIIISLRINLNYLNKYTRLYKNAFDIYKNDTTNNAQIYNTYINAKANFEQKQKNFNDSLNRAINDVDVYWLRLYYRSFI